MNYNIEIIRITTTQPIKRDERGESKEPIESHESYWLGS